MFDQVLDWWRLVDEFLGGALVASVLIPLAKASYRRLRSRRERRTNAIQRLQDLRDLIHASATVFGSQARYRNKLNDSLVHRFQLKHSPGDNYDDRFYQHHGQMDDHERELFGLVRGITVHSMRVVNEELRKWLKENGSASQLIGARGKSDSIEALDEQLMLLRKHLDDWFSKYEGVLKSDPRRSLVYLGDEKNHGQRFPQGLKKEAPVLTAVIEELSA